MRYEIVMGQGAKRNLVLDSPLVAGPNAILSNDKSASPFGAALTPLLSHHHLQITQPGFVRINSGYLLAPGYGWQPWQQARRQYRSRYHLVGKPVIATISPADTSDAFKLAQSLGSWEQIEGIALYLAEGLTPHGLQGIIQAINRATDLPLLVRLPFIDPASYLDTCGTESVVAVIVSAPPFGEAPMSEQGRLRGELHSPALVPLCADLIRQVGSDTELPIIARADASSIQDVLTLAAAGAEAVILEGALWVQPNIAEEIRQELDDLAQHWLLDNWQAFSQRLRQFRFRLYLTGARKRAIQLHRNRSIVVDLYQHMCLKAANGDMLNSTFA